MTNKVKIKHSRIKTALAYREKTITWLAVNTVNSRGKTGCTTATLYDYIRDGFPVDSARSVSKALGVSLEWLAGEFSEGGVV